MHVKNPVQADVVISETLGNFALEEHMLETLMDAKRFLKPGGALIPSSLRQFVCPVIAPRLWKEINVWKDIPFDLRWTAAEEMTLQNMYVKTVRPEELLSYGTQEWDRMDFQKKRRASAKRPCGGRSRVTPPSTASRSSGNASFCRESPFQQVLRNRQRTGDKSSCLWVTL